MAGKATAVASGTELRTKVIALGQQLGLDVRVEVRVGRRLWGAVRNIDVVLTRTETGQTLGIECKFQGVGAPKRRFRPRFKMWLRLFFGLPTN
jgi:hypothetical protein